MIVVNCCSQVGMFKVLWPQMKERSMKNKLPSRCAILDISSISSVLPLTGASVYSSTKAFNKVFTLGLSSYLSNP